MGIEGTGFLLEGIRDEDVKGFGVIIMFLEVGGGEVVFSFILFIRRGG